ncbi:MAG: gliding motility-associated C-terminal domain-containing protein [Saprospiraceae bacterium]|nr:gliding motility-associated C-terminal domain-containing protein [Saprospiraceae bacterium]
MRYFIIVLLLIFHLQVDAQLGGCTGPGLPSCQCATASVLCDIQALNGVTYQMSSYSHPADGPNPMCPGQLGVTSSQNPTWYAFPAWCSNLTLRITYTGCTFAGGSRGLQAAVYSNCSNLPGSIVAGGCATQLSGCGIAAGVRNLDLTGLNIGSTYYLLVDGCGGSACLVTIEITSPPCPQQISPIPSDPVGPTTVCVNQPVNYTGVLPTGASIYYWTVTPGLTDGVLLNENPFTHTFTSPGQYEVCFDVANDCQNPGSEPPPRCITVNAYAPNAGTLMASPNPVCPGGTINYSVSGQTPEFSQYLVISNAAGQIVKVDVGTSGSFSHPECANFTLHSFNFQPGTIPVPVVGNNISSVACSTPSNCCATTTLSLNFQDNQAPVFTNAPPNATYNCYLNVPVMADLAWTDNCVPPGTVMGTEVNNITDNCIGGTITRTWTVTDGCGNAATHVQTITVQPIPVAQFDGPASATIPCSQIPPAGTLPPLLYDNNLAGDCSIMGSIEPTRVDMLVNCTGTITYTWQTTDICGRIIMHVQVLTVEPPTEATFQNAPPSANIACQDVPPPGLLPPLTFTNGEMGGCLITGTVIPTREDNIVLCSGTITYTWQATDPCGRLIFHEQILNVQPPAEATIQNPPASATIPCTAIPAAGVLPPLDYTNGLTGSCLISGTLIPTRNDAIVNCAGTITYTWQTTDICNRSIFHQQVLTVQPPPAATITNPPVNATINCPDIPPVGTLPPLSYTNGLTGSCGVNGTLIPTRTDAIVNCAGTITYVWSTVDQCNRPITHTQILTVLPPPVATFTNPPASATINCPDIPPAGALPQLSYSNGQTGNCEIAGDLIPTRTDNIVDCAGTITYVWTTIDQCNRTLTHTQVLTVLPPPVATFTNPPASATINCPDIPPAGTLPPLSYTNGQTGSCEISGSLTPTRTDNIVDCAGTITFLWETIDQCNRTLSHTQVLTVLPPPVAVLSAMPPSGNINCDQIPPAGELPPLTYTNGQSGSCEISGTLIPTRTDNVVNCQGTITFLWQTTDQCNRPIEHTQVLTVIPPPVATYVNPPASATITCTNLPPDGVLPPLNYTNGQTGVCEISGTVIPTRTDNITNCQGTITFTWQTTDQCNRSISHTQTLTVQPPPDANYVNPPASATVPCDQAPPPGILPPLDYTNGGVGECLVEGTVIPTRVDNIVNCAGTITLTWSGTDRCGRNISHIQIITVQPPPVATFVNPPVYSTPISCSDAEAFTAPDVNYSNNNVACPISGVLTPVVQKNYNSCGGNIQITWSGTDACNRPLSYNQVIVVQKAAPPVFTGNLPQDVTVSCQDISSFNIPLNYSNAGSGLCLLTGSITPTINQNQNLCGGVATLTWAYSDACNNVLNHVQQITVDPAPQASFVNPPPSSVTISCDQVTNQPPPLSYTNGLAGFCAIAGSVPGISSGSYNSCGGNLQYTWQFTDACGRSIVYNQNITVTPATNPFFLTSPPDIDLPCGQTTYTPPNLNYANGLAGICAISGSVTPTFTDFGTFRVYTWSYTNPCNNVTITEDQTVTFSSTPDIFISPNNAEVCAGQSYNLNQIIVTNNGGGAVNITYHSATPAGSSNIIASSTVSPLVTTTYYILATNSFGCTDEAPFTLTVIPNANSGTPVDGIKCIDGSAVNLWDFLSGPYNTNGFWTDVNGTGVNLSNPAAVFFIGLPPGLYPFDYTVSSGNPLCPPATTRIFIQFVNPGTYDITDVECNASFTDYTVFFTTNGVTVTSSAGNVVVVSAGMVEIRNIPISQTVLITLTTTGTDCAPQVIAISPPDCSCPSIPAPLSSGSPKVCFGNPNPTLNVTVGGGLSASWFAASSGGTAIQTNSLSYVPTVTAPGIYSFWVESVDAVTACKSSTRTQVQFEIVANPTAMNATLNKCDDNTDGFVLFNLTNANSLITGSGNTVAFYVSLSDAQNETNPLPVMYVNTTAISQVIYALVKNSNNCETIVELTLNVFPLPDVSITVTNEVCLGNQDGTITIVVNNGSGPFEYSLDNIIWTTDPVFEDLQAKTYMVYVRNANQCVSVTPVVVTPGQRLDIGGFSAVCSNNGTPSDGSDDFYTINFNITNTTNASNSFEVTYDGNLIGTFNYGVPSSFTLPANSGTGTVMFTDPVTGCFASRDIGPLNSCSTDCLITISSLTSVCSDNGTESLSTDDFYTITLTTSVFNGGSDNMFDLFVNNVLISTHVYGQQITFNLPANGMTPIIRLRDRQNILCETLVDVPALIPCSSACAITATTNNVLCNDNGTINDPADDTFTFTIRVNGFNLSPSWGIEGQAQDRLYNTNITLGPFPVSGGNVSLNITDSADSQCRTAVNVTAPPACSEPCVLELTGLVTGACNNAGTGNTEADDVYSIDFRINVLGGSASIYKVSDGVREWGPFIYGTPVTITDLPANGQNIILNVIDQSNPGCNFNFTVRQDPCSQCTQTVNAGPDIELSCLVNTANLMGTSSVPGVIYQWTGPNNFNRIGQNAQTATPGTYYFRVTFADQCVATDSMRVTIDANLPVANAGPDMTINCLVSTVMLTGSGNVNASNAEYIWTDASGAVIGTNQTLSVTIPGTYFFQVVNTNNNCISGKDEVIVSDDTALPTAVIFADPGNLLDCVISSIVLSGQPQEDVYYNWLFGEDSYTRVSSITVNEEGLVTMTAIDSISGCSAFSQLQIVDLQDYPILLVEPAAPITCDNNETVINASNSPLGPNLVFSWFDANNNLIAGATGSTLTVNIPGRYYVMLTDTTNKCRNIDSVLVESIGAFPEFTNTNDVNLFCGNTQTTLEINITNAVPNTQISWTSVGGNIISGNGTPRITVEGSGVYSVDVLFTDSGCRSTREIRVNVDSQFPESITAATDDESCAGERDAAIRILSVVGGTPPLTYRLNNQTYTDVSNISSLSPGNYTLIVTDSNGCSLSSSFVLQAGNNLDLNLNSFIEIRRGDSTTFEVKTSLPLDQIASVKWNPSDDLSCDTCLTTLFTGLKDAEYTVVVTDINGCESTASIRVVVKGITIITTPSIFNPAGTTNKYFTVYGNNNVELIEKMRIYDRWGNLIFSQDNFLPNIPELGWDGKYKGTEVQPGVFVFLIEYRTPTGLEIHSGDVTIIR